MPAHKRGPWSQQEDHILMSLVHSQGAHNWVRISSLMGTRSPKQCRERYHQNLKPNLNHDPITPEEGEMIEQMVAEMGKRWAEIARRLRGRSDNAVKNWWNGGMNRRRRNAQRRAEMEARQQQQQHMIGQPGHAIQQHMPEQAMYFNNAAAMQRPQYFDQNQLPAIYQQQAHIPTQHAHYPQSLSVPQFGRSLRASPFESPLPSPGAYSQISADGAPSLISDASSFSQRSPHHGTSPVELPPLGQQEQRYVARRPSTSYMQRLGVPGVHHDQDAYIPMQMSRSEDGSKRPQMLQEAFNPQQAAMMYRQTQEFPQMHYPQASPLPHVYQQMAPPQHHYSQHIPSSNGMQVAHMATAGAQHSSIDPELAQDGQQGDGNESPKEKMRLSAIVSN